MTRSKTSLFYILIITTFLSGCVTKPSIPSDKIIQLFSAEQRANHLKQNKKWQLQGKIAFIEQTTTSKKRESAAINWQVNEKKHTQELNLTSYLGINVLHLQSYKKQHIIKVDGKEYRGSNLSQLIYSLTGLTLPTEALVFWLKGLQYNTEDHLEIDNNTQLPIIMSSEYGNTLWQISYSDYKLFNGINMATKLTIQTDNLLIKFAIQHWTFDE